MDLRGFNLLLIRFRIRNFVNNNGRRFLHFISDNDLFAASISFQDGPAGQYCKRILPVYFQIPPNSQIDSMFCRN